ncbi:hypothetical protein MSAN_00736200 [Mycena sanguinolenta]|uniref:HNH nuclease domain-containing protein n=1 Tax=Mycena sanguinolenta TaxID=230812 RepID=A0A8H7DE41_9AGAR|nr:hypothetical protein MSAN_00736200 [Mycena sanguinolenta]
MQTSQGDVQSRRSSRKSTALRPDDGTSRVTAHAGSPTPSPDKAAAERREGPSYDPNEDTPPSNRVMSYSPSPPLNDKQKNEVQRRMRDIGQADDRCIITNELGAINFCHLAALSTPHDQVKFLRNRWGWEDFHVNVPENVVMEESTKHYMLDHAQLVLIPEPKEIARILEVYRDLYTTQQIQQPKPFHNLFAPPPKGHGWTYGVLPLEIDPHRRIFRHQTKQGINENGVETCESTGNYKDFTYPYRELHFESHAHPLCALWHAGVEISKLSRHQIDAISDELIRNGAHELVQSITHILTLYEFWIRRPRKVDGVAVQTQHKDTHSPDQSLEPPTTPSREEDAFNAVNDSNSDGTSSDSTSPFDVSPALRAASSAPAGHLTRKTKKRKKISPVEINARPTTEGSPTQHVERKRKVGDGVSQPAASTRSLSPLLGLGSQSETGTGSSMQLAGSEPAARPSKPRVQYEQRGISTTRNEIGQRTGQEVTFRLKTQLSKPQLLAGMNPPEPNVGGSGGHTSAPGNKTSQSMPSGAGRSYAGSDPSTARVSASGSGNHTRNSSTSASGSTTRRDRDAERGSTSASGHASNTSKSSTAGPTRSETQSSTSQGGSDDGSRAGNSSTPTSHRDRDARSIGYIQQNPRQNEEAHVEDNISGVGANLSVSRSASTSISGFSRIPRPLTSNYAPPPTIPATRFFSSSSTGKRSSNSSRNAERQDRDSRHNEGTSRDK